MDVRVRLAAGVADHGKSRPTLGKGAPALTTPLLKAHTHGTHRLVAPEDTLGDLQRHLSTIGVTRVADVTGLDHLGIPVFCAIRPRGRLLQVANGKGLDSTAARVSALMEAVEFFHYESASDSWRHASLATMRGEGHWPVEPGCLAEYRAGCFFTSDYVIDWEPGEELLTGREAWLPASAGRIQAPMLFPFSSNGLASGNHLIEATLHALYEVIERDAVSRLSGDGRIRVEPPRCRCIDLDTVDTDPVGGLIDKIRRADIKLVLIRVESCIPVHTFWAVLLDRNPFSHCSAVNIGYGTHLSVSVAATRAITEAAQTRLTFIHGAREDLRPEVYQPNDFHARLFAFFDGLENPTAWQSFTDLADNDLLQDYYYLLEHLAAAGHRNVFRVTLTQPPVNIPVVKVFVPGLQINPSLFLEPYVLGFGAPAATANRRELRASKTRPPRRRPGVISTATAKGRCIRRPVAVPDSKEARGVGSPSDRDRRPG